MTDIAKVLTYLTIALGTLINLFLIFLLLRYKFREKSTWFLLGWLFFLGVVNQVVSMIIISVRNQEIALLIYRIGSYSVFFVPFFYFFVLAHLRLKLVNLLSVIAVLYSVLLPISNLLYPDLLIKNVVWNDQVGFYLADYNYRTLPFFYIAFIFWFYSFWKLYQAFLKTRSAHARNRLKYISLGALFPIIGFIGVSIPVISIRRYPLDNFGITLGAILLVYGIIKYKALDINVIIRKGLIYSLLTFFITAFYLIFSFIIGRAFHISGQTVSLPSAISTSLVIALFFQPIHFFTKTVTDRLFFRIAYDPQKLISEFADAMSSSIELEEIGQRAVTIIKKTLQIEKVILFINSNEDRPILFTAGKVRIKKVLKVLRKYPLLHKFENTDVTSIYDIGDSNIREALSGLKIEIIIPLRIQLNLIGLFIVGSKLSGETFSLEEYKLFETLGNHAAVTIQNALSFEEVVKGKKKIEETLSYERRLEELKSEFIMIGSHNLRTPLTRIRGYLGTLFNKKDEFPSETKEALEVISDSSAELSNLIEGLLTVTSVERGKISINKEISDINPIIEDLIKKYHYEAERKGLYLNFDKVVQKPIIVSMDKMHLPMAIGNLIDNAIKFTQKGGVTIEIEKDEKGVKILVKDTGPGIPQKEIPYLFTKFHQIRKAKYNAVAGVGMGLYIVKLVAKAHGGEAGVVSEEGSGSTFYISLPSL